MNKHTPGPWWIGEPHQDDEGFTEIPIHASIKGIVNSLLTPAVLCLQFENMEGMQEANARLIAAAPELLAACEIALANLVPAYASDHLVIKSLRAAISKAKD